MAILFDTDPAGRSTATFVIRGDHQDTVSVVGSFNDWTPGVNPLVSGSDGSLTATVVVEPGTELHFRYLGADGHWFDDDDADQITEDGSVVTVPNESTDPAAALDASKPAASQSPTPPAASDTVEEEKPKARKTTRT